MATRTRKSSIKTTEEKLIALSRLKDESKKIGEEMAALQAELVEEIREATGENSLDTDRIEAVIVEAERVEWDEDVLEEIVSSLPGNVWVKITSRMLDKDKLEKQFKLGKLTMGQLADAATVKKNKPYIRLKVKA